MSEKLDGQNYTATEQRVMDSHPVLLTLGPGYVVADIQCQCEFRDLALGQSCRVWL